MVENKRCRSCGEAKKKLTEFYKDKTSTDGVRSSCKTCMNSQSSTWIKENRDRFNELQRNCRIRTGYHMAWYYRNREVSAGRRAAKLSGTTKVTPRWADRDLIKDMYAEAGYFGLDVDHMVPLRSDNVCGLHCESNLHAIPKSDNARKSNRMWPDMWSNE